MSTSLLQPTHHDLYPFIDPSGQLASSAKGKSVLISGAGSGIGRAIAEAFALAGAERLFLVGRREGGLWETRGRIGEKMGLVGDVGEGEDGGRDGCEVLVISGVDISKGEDVDRMFASYFGSGGFSEGKKFPPPDLLVSNAGTSGATETIADSEPKMWWRDMEVNLKGTYLVARGYIRALREYYGSEKVAEGEEGTRGKAEGRIINVSSNASWRYVPGRSSYAASKLAINSLTEYLDGEEGGGVVDSTTSPSHNKVIVRSVALHPGGVDTDLAATLPEDVRKRILIDKPELAAGTCVYLSLPRADFLMRRFVNCTWDMEELEKHRERVKSQDLLKSKVVGMFDILPAP
ncbi:hypothetical protein D0869_14216 [Hortaea werneckii]|uniref:NAD(P)-binding protein n=1 Tax=Hortaea werneckii TaxID=91943 RepID=A0A3M6W2Q3_HORWE|nr:hypothetical protein KC324_g12140 [Hortaea werneckii]KAI7569301.1 hypothetical protein KC316_g12245 [Hortaea werneckii]RMX72832.1 hypothetical protein D0869_14216 [Hortaea werneckii]RMX90988.1 hypothetical protein D0868_14253 [Hortaea werneckii]